MSPIQPPAIAPKRSDRLSSDKADAILQGAIQAFLAQGYAATSMDRVAAAAGVSKATVYSHFQDKEGLFTALVKRMAQRKISLLYGAQSFQGEPQVVLSQLLSTALNQIRADPQHLAFMRLIIGESGRFPELAQIFVQNMAKPGIGLLSQYFAAQSNLQLTDPEATARIVIGALVHYILIQDMLQGKDIVPMDQERLIAALIQMILGAAAQSPLTS
jgi:AcrR family transcriptional regulator